jgi:chromosomal replication initiation ATPase DnaA
VRWASACQLLAAELTPAAVSAWLRPLTPVALAPAPDRGGQLLVLACNTAFHRDHVLRRYRAAIERAAGAACEVVVRPAQPESGTPAAHQPPGPAPAPAAPRPALALAPAPAPPSPLRR